MQIYLEYAILDNLIIDYYLLKSSFFLCGKKVKRARLFLTAILGTVVAIVLPLFPVLEKFSVFIKILLAFVIIILAGEYKSFKEYFFVLSVFVLLTFLSGGAVIGVLFALDMDYVVKGISCSYSGELPLSVILLTAVICTKIIIFIAKKLYKRRNLYPFIRECKIRSGEKEFALTGFIDSGNRLFDEKSGKPVVVISKTQYFKSGIYKSLIFHGKLTFSTVSGQGDMLLYQADYLEIHGEKNVYADVIIAVSEVEYHGEYDLILHPAFICT